MRRGGGNGGSSRRERVRRESGVLGVDDWARVRGIWCLEMDLFVLRL